MANPNLFAKKLFRLFDERKKRDEKINVFYSSIVDAYDIFPRNIERIIRTFNIWGSYEDYFLILEGSVKHMSMFNFMIEYLSCLFREQLLCLTLIRENKNATLSDLCDVIPMEDSRLDKLINFTKSICKYIYGNSNNKTLQTFRKSIIEMRNIRGTMIKKYLSNEKITSIELSKFTDEVIINNYYILSKYTEIQELLSIRYKKALDSTNNYTKIYTLTTYENKYIVDSWFTNIGDELNQLQTAMNIDFKKTICLIDMCRANSKIIIVHMINIILMLHYSEIETFIIEKNDITPISKYIKDRSLKEQIDILYGLALNYRDTVDYFSLKYEKQIVLISAKKAIDIALPKDEFIYWKIVNEKMKRYWSNNWSGVINCYIPDTLNKKIFISTLNKDNFFKRQTYYVPFITCNVPNSKYIILNEIKKNIDEDVANLKIELSKKEQEAITLSLKVKNLTQQIAAHIPETNAIYQPKNKLTTIIKGIFFLVILFILLLK